MSAPDADGTNDTNGIPGTIGTISTNGTRAWPDALLAAQLFAVDPAGIAGIVVRAAAGPVRDRWLAAMRRLLPEAMPMRRVPAHIGDDRLLGGLDLTATLRAGRPIAERGILADADGGVVLLGMAERVPAATAGRLAAALDTGMVAVERDGLALRLPARFGLVALDEGASDDEHPSAALLDRLAFRIDLTDVALAEADGAVFPDAIIAAARRCLAGIVADDSILEALCRAAAALGIASLRAPILALRAARALAALSGRGAVAAEDAALAARLVLGPRATVSPSFETEPLPPEPAPEDEDQGTGEGEDGQRDDGGGGTLADCVLAAALAAMPPDALSALRPGSAGTARIRSQGRAGVMRQSATRGRPIGTRAGDPRGGARLHVIETLRAAAPWQTLRRRHALASVASGRIAIRREDFRVVRFRQRTETVTIFAVDASGSAAVNRLAEAKGAVELLLADCYVRRDQVALIAFRGRGAELLLPPTGSLLRTKRCLAALPGGGPTPLAAGIDATRLLADAMLRKGRTPILVLLTDGRANIARGGASGRAQAEADATDAARAVRLAGLASLLVDISPRAHPPARALAAEMGARYVPLPQADAAALSKAVQTAARGV